MEQLNLENLDKVSKLDLVSREVLIEEIQILRTSLSSALKKIYTLQNQNISDEQLLLILGEHLSEVRGALYGSSSEKLKKDQDKEPVKGKEERDPVPRPKLPSERYPNIPIREIQIDFDNPPECDSCGKAMSDSGMKEVSEQLHVIPRKFEILRSFKSKYRCSCHSCIKTPPTPPRIIEGSSYSDAMILDVALSKYCDLIPMQRYVAMAARGGLRGLPHQSLIELTHGLSIFLKPIYEKIRQEILQSRVLHADETPHKMLEGSDKKSWYLWGFSTSQNAYFEYRDSRSGDIASDFLMDSHCEVLVSDIFSGYGKAVGTVNIHRGAKGTKKIQNAFCNAHSRRYFFKSYPAYPEAKYYLDEYREIYKLEMEEKPPDQIPKYRALMKEKFEAMQNRARDEILKYPKGLRFEKALSYFLTNYQGLTLFLDDPEVPIDNNPQERLLRSHVVGRKTWYGTHSERGAETAAILLTLIETCKLNQVNPREYFEKVTQDKLQGREFYTPNEFKESIKL